MKATETATHPARCLKCRRILRRPTPDGYGPKCRRKVHTAARTERTSPNSRYQGWQINKAIELLEMGAVVPLRQNRIFLVVSDDGSEIYRTAASGQCNCPAGLRSVRCYHAAAARFAQAA
ncbi:hypothetical protein ACFY0G_17565 [Streptomyces sp. NPDC001552]|uniref:hypothetical protein n=1 Tax=Streptomyces sp. NPDC001552 TaxID=3364587 RepID=UPI00367AD802